MVDERFLLLSVLQHYAWRLAGIVWGHEQDAVGHAFQQGLFSQNVIFSSFDPVLFHVLLHQQAVLFARIVYFSEA